MRGLGRDGVGVRDWFPGLVFSFWTSISLSLKLVGDKEEQQVSCLVYLEVCTNNSGEIY